MNFRKESLKQDKRVVNLLSEAGLPTSLTVNSGAFSQDPGDGRNDWFLVENKTRLKAGAKQFSIKRDVLKKIEQEAAFKGKTPLLFFSFDNRDDYVILRDIDFASLLQRLIEAEGELAAIKGDGGGAETS